MPKAPYAKCDSCPLKDNIFVPSEINNSRILALAEAPGFHETQEGKPLVGVAGPAMNRIIESINTCREKFATFVNAVSCRPIKIEDGKERNRTPTDQEVACCNDRLAHEIESINPLVIVAMGKIPYMALGGTVFPNFKMSDVIGTEFLYKNKYKVIVTYHPAAITHSGGVSTERGKLIRDEIKKVFERAQTVKHIDRQLKLI